MPGFEALHLLVKPNEELYFAGDEVVAVAADTEEHAEDACARSASTTRYCRIT